MLRRNLLLCALSIAACAEDPVTVQYAPGLARAGRRISIFGIERDGQMSRSGWAALGPYASRPFSEEPCELAYSDEVFNAAPDLASTMDAYVRENGVTAELLEQLAPAAKGDLVMVLTVAGHPLEAVEDPRGAGYQRSLPPSMSMGSSSHHHGRGRPQASGATKQESASDTFVVSASFFSVHERRAVGMASMRYSGANTDDALAKFTTRLEHDFPGSSCSGWDWTVHLDSTKLRPAPPP
jgi:hypothetical protein